MGKKYKIHHDARDCRCIFTICEHLHKDCSITWFNHFQLVAFDCGQYLCSTASSYGKVDLRWSKLTFVWGSLRCHNSRTREIYGNIDNIVASCQTFWEIRCNSSSAKPLAQNMLKLRAAPLQCQCGVLSPLLADNWAGSWSKLLTSNLPNGF